MPFFNYTYCQLCGRFITKEEWNKHLYSSRHLHQEVIGYWPVCFPQRKLTRNEGSILEKAFWELIFATEDCIELHELLKTNFRMCTNINNYVPVRPWFDDKDEQEQWECGFKDDMIAKIKQDLYNKSFSLQDQGKSDENDTLQNRNKFWLNVIDDTGDPLPDNLNDYVYNEDGLDILFAVQR